MFEHNYYHLFHSVIYNGDNYKTQTFYDNVFSFCRDLVNHRLLFTFYVTYYETFNLFIVTYFAGIIQETKII